MWKCAGVLRFVKPTYFVSVLNCVVFQGYQGYSCEQCLPGYYRDVKDLSKGPLGSCTRCPCSNNEHQCELGADNRVICHCLPGFTGSACEIKGM